MSVLTSSVWNWIQARVIVAPSGDLDVGEAEPHPLDLGAVGDQLEVGAGRGRPRPSRAARRRPNRARSRSRTWWRHHRRRAHGDGDVVGRGEGGVGDAQPQHVGARRGERGRGVDGAGVAEGDGAGAADLAPGRRGGAGRVGEAVVGDGAVQAGRGRQGHRPVGAGAHDGGGVARGRAGAVLDVEERGEVALEGFGRTSSGAGELDAQRVALGPSGPAHHGLDERGDVGRLLRGRPRADGGPGGRVPGHRRRRDGRGCSRCCWCPRTSGCCPRPRRAG